MTITGIICEYNPFHTGHAKQLAAVRRLQGADSGIVCLMSGNYVQRGAPALLDKSLRAKAAILCGADLVLELPTAVSLSSAEGFAAGGVAILGQFCDALCFGAETADREQLFCLAEALLSDRFPPLLHAALDSGCSFPAARQQALERMGLDASPLTSPNNILAVEYCKAILRSGCAMEAIPILRNGDYHAQDLDRENPSATALRNALLAWQETGKAIPEAAQNCFAEAAFHTLAAGERAVLTRLRTMTEADFAALPFGSEGLWRKLMHTARQQATLAGIFVQTKSKRYPLTRLHRMVMCAYLGLTQQQMQKAAPYVRVLALNSRGGQILRKARQSGVFYNAGQPVDDPYWTQEQQWGDLYGLFSTSVPDAPGMEARRRVYYEPSPSGGQES